MARTFLHQRLFHSRIRKDEGSLELGRIRGVGAAVVVVFVVVAVVVVVNVATVGATYFVIPFVALRSRDGNCVAVLRLEGTRR